MSIQPSIDLKKVNLQTAVGYLVSLHENEYQWNLLGIKVVGHIDALPIPEGTYEYGDAYMVGTETPYDMYIYTRPDGAVHTEGYWFPVGKFPMPGPQGPKGDGLEQITHEDSNAVKSVSYDSTSGATIDYADKTLTYTDSTTGEIKTQTYPAQLSLPIVPGKYISMNTTSDNNKMEVKVDDTALALDYWKIQKTPVNTTPIWIAATGAPDYAAVTNNASPGTFAYRNGSGDCDFHNVGIVSLSKKDSTSDKVYYNDLYYNCTDAADLKFSKRPNDTGKIELSYLQRIQSNIQMHIVYENEVYYRMDQIDAPSGTLNYIHINSIQDGNGAYKATGKCFSITVETRVFQVFDLEFGSTCTTHNLTLSNSSTGTNIYFSLTNNRTETYENTPADLLAAILNIPIACTVDSNGTYSAGMITTDPETSDNFKLFYGNSEELLMTQTEIVITDNMV